MPASEVGTIISSTILFDASVIADSGSAPAAAVRPTNCTNCRRFTLNSLLNGSPTECGMFRWRLCNEATSMPRSVVGLAYQHEISVKMLTEGRLADSEWWVEDKDYSNAAAR
jgi:hypothetical protein